MSSKDALAGLKEEQQRTASKRKREIERLKKAQDQLEDSMKKWTEVATTTSGLLPGMVIRKMERFIKT